jgi:hypothetical protein
LREQLFYALADLIALNVQGADFLLHCLHESLLFTELRIERFGAVLGSGASFAFALDQPDGAGNAIFESRKIGAAEGQISLLIIKFSVFGDLGFQR